MDHRRRITSSNDPIYKLERTFVVTSLMKHYPEQMQGVSIYRINFENLAIEGLCGGQISCIVALDSLFDCFWKRERHLAIFCS